MIRNRHPHHSIEDSRSNFIEDTSEDHDMDENRHEEEEDDEEEEEEEEEDDEGLTHHPMHDSSNSLAHIFASTNRYFFIN